MAISTLTAPEAVVYPTRDGRPMGETDKHRELMAYLIAALKVHFMGQPDVYVSGNNFVFWEEGQPKSRVSPDAYVVFGAEDRLRDSYMAWKEGDLLPSVVIEITSRSTQSEDIETKLPLYEQTLKTPEYFLFDPTGGYLKPRLQGYRLENGRYLRLEPTQGRLHSEQLGLDFVQIGEALRLYNPASGEFLPTPQEQAERTEAEARRAESEARRAETEARRAKDAEAENARLRAEIEALKGHLKDERPL